ncbi:hypothetical protein BKA62DRAFT_695383 [Auriculariales sp. MPI-PUGE-AT-0066]|nr:hypothetical protein BKA62DRAFT_695383 [Auriculariales sp. MPI-PUGE-AT-0066]
MQPKMLHQPPVTLILESCHDLNSSSGRSYLAEDTRWVRVRTVNMEIDTSITAPVSDLLDLCRESPSLRVMNVQNIRLRPGTSTRAKSVGRHVESLNVVQYIRNIHNLGQDYAALLELISSMPNLRRLRLNSYRRYGRDESPSQDSAEQSHEHIIRNIHEKHQWPQFVKFTCYQQFYEWHSLLKDAHSSLKKLSLLGFWTYECIEPLVRAAQDISFKALLDVQIHSQSRREAQLWTQFVATLPRLRRLTMYGYTSFPSDDVSDGTFQILVLSGLCSPLRTLELACERGDREHCSELWNLANQIQFNRILSRLQKMVVYLENNEATGSDLVDQYRDYLDAVCTKRRISLTIIWGAN